MAEQTKYLTDAELEALRGHTPGETWNLRPHGVIVAGVFHRYTNGAAQSQIACVTILANSAAADPSAERDANARLMHAAPALLAEVVERRAKDAAVAELVEAVSDLLASHPAAVTYPDGPCIEKQTRKELAAALAAVRGGEGQ